MQFQHVNKIPHLGAAGEGKDLVDSRIPEIQAPAKLIIWFDWKKAESSVQCPFHFGALPLAFDGGSPEGFVRMRDVNLVTGLAQRFEVTLNRQSKALDRVVKNIDILRCPQRGGISIEHCSSGDETVGVAIGSEQTQHFTFELA